MPTFKHRRELVSRSENKNDSEPTEPANHEPVVPASTLDSVTEDSGSVAVLSSHNGKPLCTWCRGINIESLTAHGGYMHAPSPEALSKGCALCTFIECSVKDQHGQMSVSVCLPDLRTETSDAFLEINCCGNGRDRSRSEEISTRISITAFPGDPALDFGIPAIASLTSTASPQSFETAKRWLRDCISHHTCSESQHYLVNDKPSRLLDLDAFGDYSTAVRLQDASAVHGNYAALSYCWGTIQQQRFMTTLGTLDSRMSRIDYCDVPKSFQHAFQICNTLGIQYLWIDALCILQDSASDWETESTKIGAIYSNAHITIAADWSPDTDGGCYHTTADSHSKNIEALIKITSVLSDGHESSIYFVKDYYPTEMFDIDRSILNTRAWALQERLLSRRILHYTKRQIYWECRSDVWAEDLIPRNLLRSRPYPGIINSRQLSVFNQSDAGVLYVWYHIIIHQSYTARNITYASDRLPAVSAVASLISHFTNSSYLAGLWDYDLPIGLSWYRTGAIQPVSRLSNMCPSWSWASLDSEVMWYSRVWAPQKEELLIYIEESFVNLEGTDPFGRVRGGFIKLRGRITRCRLAGHESALPDIIAEDGTYLGRADMDTSESVSQVYCLILFSRKGKCAGGGLVLSLTSAERQKYRRLGYAHLRGPPGNPKTNRILAHFQNCTEQTIILI